VEGWEKRRKVGGEMGEDCAKVNHKTVTGISDGQRQTIGWMN